MIELAKAEALRYSRMWVSAKRRADQDVAAGRQPSRDDMARLERYMSLCYKAVEVAYF